MQMGGMRMGGIRMGGIRMGGIRMGARPMGRPFFFRSQVSRPLLFHSRARFAHRPFFFHRARFAHRVPFHHRRFHRRVFFFGGFPVYANYGYGYNCYWLRRQALYTGSPYWWSRYRACVYGYGYGY